MTPKKDKKVPRETPEPNPVGRPIALEDPETRALFLAACAFDMNVEACCAYAKIHKSTYYRYIEDHPEFSDEIEEKRQIPYQKLVQKVLKAAETDPKLALAYLERKHKDEFSPRREITGAGGAGLFERMSDDDLENFIQG